MSRNFVMKTIVSPSYPGARRGTARLCPQGPTCLMTLASQPTKSSVAGQRHTPQVSPQSRRGTHPAKLAGQFVCAAPSLASLQDHLPSELLRQVVIQDGCYWRLTMERPQDFLSAERELFEAYAHRILNGVGDRGRGPETGRLRHGARPKRTIGRRNLHQNVF